MYGPKLLKKFEDRQSKTAIQRRNIDHRSTYIDDIKNMVLEIVAALIDRAGHDGKTFRQKRFKEKFEIRAHQRILIEDLL